MPKSAWTPLVEEVGENERNQVEFGHSLLKEERYEEALSEFQRVLASNPKSYEAVLGSASVHVRQKNFDEAGRLYQRAMALKPLEPKGYMRAGVAYLRASDYESAQRAFEDLLALGGRDARAHLGLAQCYIKQGKTDEAVPHLREALRLAPDDPRVRTLLSQLYTKEGQVDRAIAELEAIAREKPDHRRTRVMLGRLYSQSENPEGAVESLTWATEQGAGGAMLWHLLAGAQLQTGQEDAAEEALRKAVELRPRGVSDKLRLAEVLISRGKGEEARALLKSMPRRKGVTSQVHRLSGDLHWREGRAREAAECYRSGLLTSTGGNAEVARVQAAGADPADWEHLAEAYREALVRLLENAEETQRPARASGARGVSRGAGAKA